VRFYETNLTHIARHSVAKEHGAVRPAAQSKTAGLPGQFDLGKAAFAANAGEPLTGSLVGHATSEAVKDSSVALAVGEPQKINAHKRALADRKDAARGLGAGQIEHDVFAPA